MGFLFRPETAGEGKRREQGMKRRAFLKKGVTQALYAAAGLILAWPVFSFVTYRKNRKKEIIFAPGEQASGVTFKEGVFLVKEKGTRRALSARCTHLGCTLRYDPVARRFRCPCHGSVFDLGGGRISGPARKNLKELPVKKKTGGERVVTLTT